MSVKGLCERIANMKTCELSVIKYLLFVFNLVFAISGIGLIVAGSVILADVGEFSHFVEGKILAPPIVLIVAGCIVFLVASLGCYGAIRESYNMLMAFALCLLIIFVIELSVGIAAACYKNEVDMGIRDLMKDSMQRYNSTKSDRIAWDNLQSRLECCGVDSATDWPRNARPLSCCHSISDDSRVDSPTQLHCNNAIIGDPILYSYGCFEELQTKASKASTTLIGVGIGIAFVEVIGIILACLLASAIKNKE